jgi:hypothetical protein
MTEQEIDLLKADFRNFVYYLWDQLGLPVPTEVQYDISLYLQHGPKRRMVQAFRGVGKSWLTAAYVLWRLLRNPNERVLVVSASKDRADAFAVFVKRLIDTVPVLQHLKPDPSKGQRDSALSFDVGPSEPHQAPSVRAVGITGQLTGGRATLIVADDVETPKNSLTLLMRERLAELIKEFDAVLSPGGEIVYLGTPQCEESIYNLLPDRGYDIRVWPARYPDGKWMEAYGHRLANAIRKKLASSKVGESTDPDRFSNEDLADRERSYGRSGFALQFQLDTRLSDADRYPLRLSDFIVLEQDCREQAPLRVTWGSGPDQILQIPSVGLKGDRFHRSVFQHETFAPYTGSVMFIDPAGRGKDETAYAVVKILNSTLYLTASGGFSGGGYDDDTLQALANVAAQQSVNLVLVEPNFGDGMFLKLFQPWLLKSHRCSLEEADRATVQKEKRIIDVLEPILNQHRLVVAESVVRADLTADDPSRQLFYQLTRVTREKGALKFDDRLDALAGAVAYWIDHLAKAQDAALEASVEKLRKADLKKFLKAAGSPAGRPGKVSRQYTLG